MILDMWLMHALQRASASHAKLQLLNPHVEVVVDEGAVESKPNEYFAAFNVVLAVASTLSAKVRSE